MGPGRIYIFISRDIKRRFVYKIVFKKGIIETTPGKIYIFAIKTENPGTLINIFLQPKISDKNIILTDQPSPLVMYFSKDIEEYTINYANNKYNRIIHLSKATPDSEIMIKNLQTGRPKRVSFSRIL